MSYQRYLSTTTSISCIFMPWLMSSPGCQQRMLANEYHVYIWQVAPVTYQCDSKNLTGTVAKCCLRRNQRTSTLTPWWARLRLKSPACRLFTAPFAHAQIKENIKLRVTGICEGNSPVNDELHTQRASNEENISIWLRHHDVIIFSNPYPRSYNDHGR